MLDTNNTNVTSDIQKFFNEFEYSEKDTLRKHQRYVVEYYKKFRVNLGIFFEPGLGKTFTMLQLAKECQKEGYKIVFITTKKLIVNIQQGADYYKKLTGVDLKLEQKNFINIGSSLNKKVGDVTANIFEEKLKNIMAVHQGFDNVAFFIDEAHIVTSLISNGSKIGLEFYDNYMASNCKLFLLTGTPILSDPYVMSVMINMLKRQHVIPEEYELFKKYFYKDGKLINKDRLANYAFGHMSIATQENLENWQELFPEQLPDRIVEIKMSENQYADYCRARVDEQKIKHTSKRKVSRFGKVASGGDLRTESRQISNYSAPIKYQKTNLSKLEIFQKLTYEECESPKFMECLKIANSQEGKGLFKLAFVNLAGTGTLAKYLRGKGWKQLNPTKYSSKYNPVDKCEYSEKEFLQLDNVKKGNNFYVIDGSVSNEAVEKIMTLHNKKANNDGEYSKFVILSSGNITGLDFSCTRWSVSVDGDWGSHIDKQFRKRSNRYKSHIDLPKEKQNTVMYYLISVSHEEESTDQYIYNKQKRVGELVDEAMDIIKSVSIDCAMNNPQICRQCERTNVKLYSPSNSSNVHQNFLDDMHDCDYCQPADSIDVEEISIFIGDEEKKFFIDSNENVYYVDGNDYKLMDKTNPMYQRIIDNKSP